MFDVIICTISSGRVQHKFFDTWEEAQRCADHWASKNAWSRQSYRVSITQRDIPAVRSLESIRQDEAA